MALHGPHQAALKSTITYTPLLELEPSSRNEPRRPFDGVQNLARHRLTGFVVFLCPSVHWFLLVISKT